MCNVPNGRVHQLRACVNQSLSLGGPTELALAQAPSSWQAQGHRRWSINGPPHTYLTFPLHLYNTIQ